MRLIILASVLFLISGCQDQGTGNCEGGINKTASNSEKGVTKLGKSSVDQKKSKDKSPQKLGVTEEDLAQKQPVEEAICIAQQKDNNPGKNIEYENWDERSIARAYQDVPYDTSYYTAARKISVKNYIQARLKYLEQMRTTTGEKQWSDKYEKLRTMVQKAEN